MAPAKRFPNATFPASIVLDVAAAVPVVVRRLANEYSDFLARSFFRTSALVPESWLLDLANEVLRFERMGWCTAIDVTNHLDVLDGYPIRIDTGMNSRIWGSILDVARNRVITVRQAAYLELAARKKLPLATIDAPLVRAAQAAGVPLFTP